MESSPPIFTANFPNSLVSPIIKKAEGINNVNSYPEQITDATAIEKFISKLQEKKKYGVFHFSLFDLLQNFYKRLSLCCTIQIEFVGGGLLWFLGEEYFKPLAHNKEEEINLTEILKRSPNDFDIRIKIKEWGRISPENLLQHVENVFLEFLQENGGNHLKSSDILRSELKKRKIVKSGNDHFAIYGLEGQPSLDLIFAFSFAREHLFISDALKLDCTAIFSETKSLLLKLPEDISFPRYLTDLFSKTISLRPDGKINGEDSIIICSRMTRYQEYAEDQVMGEAAKRISQLPKETQLENVKKLISIQMNRFRNSLGASIFFWNYLRLLHRYKIVDNPCLNELWGYFSSKFSTIAEKEWSAWINGILQRNKNDWEYCFALDHFYAICETFGFYKHSFRGCSTVKIIQSKLYLTFPLEKEEISLIYPFSLEKSIPYLKNEADIPQWKEYSLDTLNHIQANILSQSFVNSLIQWQSQNGKMGTVLLFAYLKIEKDDRMKCNVLLNSLKSLLPNIVEIPICAFSLFEIAEKAGLLSKPIPELKNSIPDFKKWDFILYLGDFVKESLLEKCVGYFLKFGNIEDHFFENICSLSINHPRLALMILLENSKTKKGIQLIAYWNPILQLVGNIGDHLEIKNRLYPAILATLQRILKASVNETSWRESNLHLEQFLADCVGGNVVLDVKSFFKEVLKNKILDSQSERTVKIWESMMTQSLEDNVDWLCEGLQLGLPLNAKYKEFFEKSRFSSNQEVLLTLWEKCPLIDFYSNWLDLASEWFIKGLYEKACPIFDVLYEKIDYTSSFFSIILQKVKWLNYRQYNFLKKIIEIHGEKIEDFYLRKANPEEIVDLWNAYKKLFAHSPLNIEISAINILYNPDTAQGRSTFEKWLDEHNNEIVSLDENSKALLYSLIKKQWTKDSKRILKFLEIQKNLCQEISSTNESLFCFFLDSLKMDVDFSIIFLSQFRDYCKVHISKEKLESYISFLIKHKNFKPYIHLEKVTDLIHFYELTSFTLWKLFFIFIKDSSEKIKKNLLNWFFKSFFERREEASFDEKNEIWQKAMMVIKDQTEYHFPLIEVMDKSGFERDLSKENQLNYLQFSLRAISRPKVFPTEFSIATWKKKIIALFESLCPLTGPLAANILEMHLLYLQATLNQEILFKAEYLLKLLGLVNEEKIKLRLENLLCEQLVLLAKDNKINQEKLFNYIIQLLTNGNNYKDQEIYKNSLIILVNIGSEKSLKKALEILITNFDGIKRYKKEIFNSVQILLSTFYTLNDIEDKNSFFYLLTKEGIGDFLNQEFIEKILPLIVEQMREKKLQDIFPSFVKIMKQICEIKEINSPLIYAEFDKIFSLLLNVEKKPFEKLWNQFSLFNGNNENTRKIRCHFLSIISDYKYLKSDDDLACKFIKISEEHFFAVLFDENEKAFIRKNKTLIFNHLNLYLYLSVKYMFHGYLPVQGKNVAKIVDNDFYRKMIHRLHSIGLINDKEFARYSYYTASFINIRPNVTQEISLFTINECCEASNFLFQFVNPKDNHHLEAAMFCYTKFFMNIKIHEFKLFILNLIGNFQRHPYLLTKNFYRTENGSLSCFEWLETQIKNIEKKCDQHQREIYDIWEKFVSVFFECVENSGMAMTLENMEIYRQILIISIHFSKNLFGKAKLVLSSEKMAELYLHYIKKLLIINSSIQGEGNKRNHTKELIEICQEALKDNLTTEVCKQISEILKDLSQGKDNSTITFKLFR